MVFSLHLINIVTMFCAQTVMNVKNGVFVLKNAQTWTAVILVSVIPVMSSVEIPDVLLLTTPLYK